MNENELENENMSDEANENISDEENKAEKTGKKKKLSGKKKALIVIVLILIAALVSVVVTANHYMGLINHVGEIEKIAPEDEFFETDPNATGEVIDPNTVKWDMSGPIGDEHLLNLLLVGQDKREGQGRQRSDVMMILSINIETKQASLISFMRDLYVMIPGYSDNRLNAAYVFGGFDLLKETLYKNFGVTVDGCFEFDFNGFIKAIDVIGGIDIPVTRAEASALGISYKGGEDVHMNGETALRYTRLRKIDSDFERTDRQRRVVLAAADNVRSCSVKELIEIVNAILPSITTDMSTKEIYSLVAKAAPLVSSVQIKTCQVPGSGTYKNAVIRGMQVLVPDLAAVKKELREEYMPF